MGRVVGEGAAIVEAEVRVVIAISKSSAHREAVVLVEEEVEEVVIATMIEGEGLEAEVLDEGADTAEVLGEGEIEVQLGKEVRREEQRLNNGTGKRKRQDLGGIMAVGHVGKTGKAVLRGGQRLSNGIERKKRQILLNTIILTLTMAGMMVVITMENSLMMISRSSSR